MVTERYQIVIFAAKSSKIARQKILQDSYGNFGYNERRDNS